MKKLYITTTIPYVNGDPHIGHALEYVEADAKARYERLKGNEVYFLAGTDENALKNVQAAAQAGQPVKQFVEEKSTEFLRLRETLLISFDDFIRTTETRHFAGAQKFWRQCAAKDIYKKKYKGLYCVGCEAFYAEDDLEGGLCPEHKKPPEPVEEENYFFRLSSYQRPIEDMIENDVVKVYPDNRKREFLAFIRQGLEDFSISRSIERAHGWGVPVPGDKSQIMYVWFDALTNYLTALDYSTSQKRFKKYWNQTGQKERRVAHVLGKGVARFHLVYWLAMLLSAGEKLPTEEFVHAYITVNGEKMSKSLGNVVNPHELVAKYGPDATRYFFLGALSPAQDGDFNYARFEEYYTAHLANGVGNLTSRVLTMIEKYSGGKIPAKAKDVFATPEFWRAYDAAFAAYRFDEMVGLTQELVTKLDALINQEKPWEKAKEGKDISALLYQLTEGLRHLALALLPVIPGSAAKILGQLGIKAAKLSTLKQEQKWGRLKKGGRIKKDGVLFPRLHGSD